MAGEIIPLGCERTLGRQRLAHQQLAGAVRRMKFVSSGFEQPDTLQHGATLHAL
jgi:hypothetical protein